MAPERLISMNTELAFRDMPIAVVIPAYKCKGQIVSVVESVPAYVRSIFVVDDCCPDGTGRFVRDQVKDPRVNILFNDVNLGVGGATLKGFAAARKGGAEILVKIDGDGQMDPSLVAQFSKPIQEGLADYTKGNRFVNFETLGGMPKTRLFGNLMLSFLTKFSTGCWSVFDPTNGYVAMHGSLVHRLDISKVSQRYFFETDMLFRLNLMRAVIVDIPMYSVYGDEESHLKISKILPEFIFKHVRNFCKRIVYQYFLKDFNFGTLQFVLGSILLTFGSLWSSWHWYLSYISGEGASVGTVMVGLLPILMGFQLLLGFFSYDVSNQSSTPLHRLV